MKFSKLYLFLFVSVLLASCGTDESPEREGEPRDDTGADTTVTAPDGDQATSSIILFLGNSLSAGYGIDSDDAFPNLIQRRIDSLGWNYRVVNAGLSGETSSGGLRRVDWLLRQPISVLVLELGGNDGLRGVPPEVTRENLAGIIEKTRSRFPNARILLAGMQIPPNLGHEYTRRFRDVYPTVADEHDAELIPFLLEGVGGVDSLMQSDGIHPTEEGHRIVAENVWEVLKPVLEDARDSLPLQSAP